MTQILRVFIAGPYTKHDVAVNVAAAMRAWHELRDHGFSPFCPHLSHYLHLPQPREYGDWLSHDRQWLEVCDALFRLPGKSYGADGEVTMAVRLGIPVFDDIAGLVAARDERSADA